MIIVVFNLLDMFVFSEGLSASSCRKVHSEILASVTRIKCSLLGRKGGLLQSYNDGILGTEATTASGTTSTTSGTLLNHVQTAEDSSEGESR